jgi:hypothetical protein
MQAMSGVEALNKQRAYKEFKKAQGARFAASSPTLHQRLDARAATLPDDDRPATGETLFARLRPDAGARACGSPPLEVGANGRTVRQGACQTCQ